MKKRQKKQYRPIAGQRWCEKFLDWVTSENFFGLLSRDPLFIVIYLFAWVLLAHIFFDNSETALLLFIPLFLYYLFVIPAGIIHLIGSFWEIGAEKKLKKSIEEYIDGHGFCTYDELLMQCMPVKIHLGIDSTIEKMLQYHELVLDADDRYRLPTDEDRKKWRKEWLEEYGVKISFEDLEKIFALDLKESEESIDIEFSLGEHDGYWIGKTKADDSDKEVFWCSADIFTAPRRDFATFQDLVETELFDGQSLEAVWDDVTITFINDHDMDFWLEEHLPYCD